LALNERPPDVQRLAAGPAVLRQSTCETLYLAESVSVGKSILFGPYNPNPFRLQTKE